MVLEMLKEGRITATEAASLLEALKSDTQRPADPDFVEGIARDATTTAKRIAREAKSQMKAELKRVREEADDAFREIKDDIDSNLSREVIDDAVEGGLSHIGSLVSGIIGNLSGSEYKYPKTMTGELPEGDVVTVAIRGVNGRIVVEPFASDDGQFELKAVGKLRAASEEEAREALSELYTVQQTGQGLVITAEKVFGQSKSVDFSLRLPGDRKYALELRSTNGSITVGALQVTTARITTTNGKIKLAADGEEFVLHSTNGRVEVDGCAEKTSCGTVNGRIVYACPRPISGQASLSTVNGSIRISLPKSSSIGLRFFGESRTGSVRSTISGQSILLDEKRRVGRKLHIERAGTEPRMEINAKSVVGSIHLDEAQEV